MTLEELITHWREYPGINTDYGNGMYHCADDLERCLKHNQNPGRDPEVDTLLYGYAYGVRRPGGEVEWLDPRDVVLKRYPGKEDQ